MFIAALVFTGLARAADPAEDPATARQASSISEELARLKRQIASQDAQIQELRAILHGRQPESEDRKERVLTEPPAAPPVILKTAALSSNIISQGTVQTRQPVDTTPMHWSLGRAAITPIGFMDFTTVYRDKNGGSGIGTNFGSIPFSNTVAGQIGEYRFSAQNSRIGVRVDTRVGDEQVLGYLETDFLGVSPPNAAVSSNSNGLRIRLYWVDVKKDKFEVLGGQSWSLLTPNREGLSPLPSNLFNTQVIDVNYHVGLTWSRNPQVRIVYHRSPRIAMGISLESSEQYGGGSAGGGVITLPSALASAYAGQLDTGGSNFSVPNARPDVIAKIAFDPRAGGRSVHIELAGLLTSFKFRNPLTNASLAATGGGAAVNCNVEAARNLRLISNNYVSDGGARWLFGQGPDLIIRGDGSPSLIHASSTLDGLEYQATPHLLMYAYYGRAFFQRNAAVDPATGRLVGYGYLGSPSGHNRQIEEMTGGLTRTFWKNPKYGALQSMLQYSYLSRAPWTVAEGQPSSTHINMAFVTFRYTLAGAPPAVD